MKDLEKKIQDCFFDMLESYSLSDITMQSIAKELDVPLGNVFDVYPSISDVLRGFRQKIDQKMEVQALENFAGEALTVEEKLLELFMIRYDLLAPYKKHLKNFFSQIGVDEGVVMLPQLPALKQTIDCMLQLSGQEIKGLKYIVHQKGLMYVYLRSLCVWLRDETADLSKTMSCVDRELQRGKSLLNRFDLAV